LYFVTPCPHEIGCKIKIIKDNHDGGDGGGCGYNGDDDDVMMTTMTKTSSVVGEAAAAAVRTMMTNQKQKQYPVTYAIASNKILIQLVFNLKITYAQKAC